MNPTRDTLFTALVEALGRFGRRTPGQWEDMKPAGGNAGSLYTYGDLLKLTLALGRLAAKVTQEGEHVGVLMPNLASTVGLLVGLSAFRRVPCMLNYTAGREGLRNACQVAGIRTVLTSRVFLKKADLEGQVADWPEVEILCLEDLRPRFGLADKLWLMAWALWFPLRAVPTGDPEAPAVVLFTSGTEGKPKGVVLSHRALLGNVAQILEVLPFGPQERFFNCLPIFHSFGLTAGTLLPLVCGARLTLYPTPLHYKAIPELVRERGSTVLFGTSTFLGQYARNAGPDDLRSLRYVVAGAEKLAEHVRRLWQDKFGIEIMEGYGATETAPVLAVNLPQTNRPGSVGRLLPGIEARLIPVPGVAVGGELHVRGPNLMSGYYRYEAPAVLDPPRSEAGAGWHDTGDVVEIDADGYLHIVGRLKRFAKVGGEMVSLEATEALARAVSPEAAHAAIAVADAGRGECILLYTTDHQLRREALAAAARARGCTEIALPRRIELLETLPLLGSGKVNYAALQTRESG